MASKFSTDSASIHRPDALMQFLEQSMEAVCLASGSSILSPYLGWTSRPHTVITQIKSNMHVQLEGEKNKLLLSGVAHILPEGTRFQNGPAGEDLMLMHWGHFRFRVLGELDLFHFVQPPLDLGRKVGAKVGALNRHLQKTCEESSGPLIVRVAQRRLCSEMLSLIVSVSRPRPGAIETIAALTRITPVLRFMREQMARPIFLAELAGIVGLSPPHFDVVFQNAIRQTPLQYLTRLRIKQAQELLLTTQQPVQEISQAVGFRDAFHFSRTFKRNTGIEPRDYRQASLLSLSAKSATVK